MERDWYTTTEAAAELGIEPNSVRVAIKRGQLKPERIHSRLSVITREELERYRRENLGRRGPKPHDAPQSA
jgi:hypothetical protein